MELIKDDNAEVFSSFPGSLSGIPHFINQRLLDTRHRGYNGHNTLQAITNSSLRKGRFI